jgi:hypothetical protein
MSGRVVLKVAGSNNWDKNVISLLKDLIVKCHYIVDDNMCQNIVDLK